MRMFWYIGLGPPRLWLLRSKDQTAIGLVRMLVQKQQAGSPFL